MSHFFFVDDSLLLFRANDRESGQKKMILSTYKKASGQSINFQKSRLSFSANVSKDDQLWLCHFFGIARSARHHKYLRLPANVGKGKTDTFRYIKDHFRRRIMTWGGRFLSRSGKEILLKCVAQSLPTNAMNVFLLPLELCSDLEKIMNGF